jgi:hypothetical protein
MKVSVVTSPKNSKEYTVELQQGAQYFRLDYTGTKDECKWYAKMFRTALKKHDAEYVKPASRTRKPKTLPMPDLEVKASA